MRAGCILCDRGKIWAGGIINLGYFVKLGYNPSWGYIRLVMEI